MVGLCIGSSLFLSLYAEFDSRAFHRRLFDKHPPARARQLKDCSPPILADLFFIILVLWGAFFTLNLLLAVLETNFSQDSDSEVIVWSVLACHGGAVFHEEGQANHNNRNLLVYVDRRSKIILDESNHSRRNRVVCVILMLRLSLRQVISQLHRSARTLRPPLSPPGNTCCFSSTPTQSKPIAKFDRMARMDNTARTDSRRERE